MITTDIKTLQLKNVWTTARNSSRIKQNVFVEWHKDGIVGVGEAAPNIRYGEDAETTRQKIHRAADALDRQDLSCYVQVKAIIDQQIVGQNCARASLDIALMDWAAKRLNVPLYRLLGLNPDAAPLTSYSIGIDDIETIKAKIHQAADYPILKIKVGSENDKDIIAAVRSVTDKLIRVDANEGWKDKELAVRMIEWMQSQGVEFVEQPMPAAMLEETGWVRQRVGLPLVADEAALTAADIPALADVYDGINIKLMKAGGIQEALTMIRVARALGLKVMLGCMIESSLAITAAAHLSPLADWADLDGHLLIGDDPFCGVTVRQGKLILNNCAGLGVAAAGAAE